MKKALFSLVLIMSVIVSFAAVSVRYQNKDSKTHTFKVKIEGRTTEVTFKPGTSNVTVQGNAKECVIFCDCGEVKVKAGDELEIKNGCIKVK